MVKEDSTKFRMSKLRKDAAAFQMLRCCKCGASMLKVVSLVL